MPEKRKTRTKVSVTGYTTEEERKKWRGMAEKEGRSLSRLIVMLLRDHFDKTNTTTPILENKQRAS